MTTGLVAIPPKRWAASNQILLSYDRLLVLIFLFLFFNSYSDPSRLAYAGVSLYNRLLIVCEMKVLYTTSRLVYKRSESCEMDESVTVLCAG